MQCTPVRLLSVRLSFSWHSSCLFIVRFVRICGATELIISIGEASSMAGRTEMRWRYCVLAFCRLPVARQRTEHSHRRIGNISSRKWHEFRRSLNSVWVFRNPFGNHSIWLPAHYIESVTGCSIFRPIYFLCGKPHAHKNSTAAGHIVTRWKKQQQFQCSTCSLHNNKQIDERAQERVMERMRCVEQLCGLRRLWSIQLHSKPANVLINAHRFIWFIVFCSLFLSGCR